MCISRYSSVSVSCTVVLVLYYKILYIINVILLMCVCLCVHQGSTYLCSVFWTHLVKTGHQHHEGQKTLEGEDEEVHPSEEVAGNMTEQPKHGYRIRLDKHIHSSCFRTQSHHTIFLVPWQKTGHAVRAIGRLSSMAMMAGVSAKKGSPTEGMDSNSPPRCKNLD